MMTGSEINVGLLITNGTETAQQQNHLMQIHSFAAASSFKLHQIIHLAFKIL